MEDRTDKMRTGAAGKWTAPPKMRKARVGEQEEGAVLGKDPAGSATKVAPPKLTTAPGRAQGHAEWEFLAARQRAEGPYLDRLPVTYDGNGHVHQKTITKHFMEWVAQWGEEMTNFAVTKFFNEVYLYEQEEDSYEWAPHSNLSNWMKVPGSRAIRTELRWRGHVARMKAEA